MLFIGFVKLYIQSEVVIVFVEILPFSFFLINCASLRSLVCNCLLRVILKLLKFLGCE